MVDPDACVAVVALELQREAEVERGALVRFGHDACVLGEDRWEQLREPFPQRGRRTIWRVGEYEVVALARAPEEVQSVAAVDDCFDADLAEVPLDRGGVVVDERDVSSTTRESLDTQRARACEEVEDPQVLDVSQHVEDGAPHLVRRWPDG